MTSPSQQSPLFPYTTLFRSEQALLVSIVQQRHLAQTVLVATLDTLALELDLEAQFILGVRVAQCLLVGDLAALEQVERSEEHTSELQSRGHIVCRLLLEKNK